MQSKGLEIILNDSLRKGITDLYEDRYKYLLTYEKERIDYNNYALEIAMEPYYGTKNLSNDIMPNTIILKGTVQTLLDFNFFRNIRNFDLLKQDKEIHGMIKDIEIWATIFASEHERVRNKVLNLIDQIDEELEND